MLQLRQEQFHVAGIHSEYPQELRTAILRAFREGGVDVLVCASLLERGIDLEVDEVILYEVPDTIEKVKHRAGRTGRGGRKGRVTVLITKECTIVKEYKRFLKDTLQVRLMVRQLKLFISLFLRNWTDRRKRVVLKSMPKQYVCLEIARDEMIC